jgi:uncharacterized protein
MKKIYVLIVLLFSAVMHSQTFREEFTSNKLDSKREIKIKLPASFEGSKDRKYPLVLVLDAEYLFSPFEGNLSYGNYWGDIPEVILVGINQNKNKLRDDDCEFDPTTGLPDKKGADFFDFIATELIPYLETKYRVGNFKIIAGLDITAGMANAFLLKEKTIFKGYISLSPELAKNMEVRIPQRLEQIKEPLFYYQATADGDLKEFQEDIKLLDKNIATVKNPMINYKFEDFKEATHYSLVAHAIPSALYQFFAVYKPISTTEYQEKIVTLKEGYVDYLNKKYEVIEKTLGLKMNYRLNDFKAIETAIIKNEAYTEYEQLAQISGQQFPKTMMYDYHMGMYYEKKGEVKKALKNYQNAFTKLEIGDLTKDMMLNKAEDLKKLLPKKGIKGGKAKEITEEVPLTDAPVDTPVDTPTEEKPKEEKKPN